MDWQKNHRKIQIHNQIISFVDTEEGEEAIFILHDFATSSYDYHKVIDELKKSYRVIIPDLIGFGYSSKPKNYFYTARDQASLLTVFLKELDIKNTSIIAQGFGTCILGEIKSILELGFTPLQINDVFIINSGAQLALTKNETDLNSLKRKTTESLIKMSLSFEMFKKYLKTYFYNDKTISEEIFTNYWEMLNFDNGIKTMEFVDMYMLETNRYSLKRLKNLKSLEANKCVIWGKNDELNSLEAFEKIKELLGVKTEKTEIIENCGHFPMLEKPEEFTKVLQKLKKST